MRIGEIPRANRIHQVALALGVHANGRFREQGLGS